MPLTNRFCIDENWNRWLKKKIITSSIHWSRIVQQKIGAESQKHFIDMLRKSRSRLRCRQQLGHTDPDDFYHLSST